MQNTRILEGVQARSHSSGWNLPPRTPPDLSQFGLREQYWGGPDLRSARPRASGPPQGPPRSAPACVLGAAREGVSRGGRISPPLRAVPRAAGTAPGTDVHGGGAAPALASLLFEVLGAPRGRRTPPFCVGAEHQGLRGQTGPCMGAREWCWVGAQPALPTGPPGRAVTHNAQGPCSPQPQAAIFPLFAWFQQAEGSKVPPPQPLLGTDSCLSPGSLRRLGGSACRGRPGRWAGCMAPGCRRGPGQPPRVAPMGHPWHTRWVTWGWP